MSVIRIYRDNRIRTLATIKNGTGGGAPALDEDPNFPTSNIRLAPRYRFWRTSSAVPGTFNLDIDCITANPNIKAIGLAMIRSYRGTAGITTLEVGSATTYLPGSWTQRLAPTAIAASDNDVMYDFGAGVANRYWRFIFTSAGQFSCGPWLVTAPDVIDLQEGFDLFEAIARVRAPEVPTLLKNVVFTDLGGGKAQKIRNWRFRDTASTLQKTTGLRLQQGSIYGPLMMKDIYGATFMVTALGEQMRWGSSGVVISNRVELDYEIGQVP